MIQPSPAINHVDSGRENPVHVFYRFSQTREIEPEAVRVDAATRSFGCSAARPLCLVVAQGVPVQDAIAGGRVDGAVRGLLVDQRGVGEV